ncbi:hypothetical protein B4102_1815 [Heyndrickxia sporothermodurans]|uniref:Uncharacterized protein n=1 Tax=Heyndrickxia sporothermodurans TaxID=46224 RepID=A0A150LHA2_9BACI|nr:hypothetical protein B4102_1815 [Heyndrickxia sporothermodurans]
MPIHFTSIHPKKYKRSTSVYAFSKTIQKDKPDILARIL